MGPLILLPAICTCRYPATDPNCPLIICRKLARAIYAVIAIFKMDKTDESNRAYALGYQVELADPTA